MAFPPFYCVRRGAEPSPGGSMDNSLNNNRDNLLDDLVENDFSSKKEKKQTLEYFLNKGKKGVVAEDGEGRKHNMAEIMLDVDFAGKVVTKRQDECKLSDVLRQRQSQFMNKSLDYFTPGQLRGFTLQQGGFGVDLFPGEVQKEYEAQKKIVEKKWAKKEAKIFAKKAGATVAKQPEEGLITQELNAETLEVPPVPESVPKNGRSRGRPRKFSAVEEKECDGRTPLAPEAEVPSDSLAVQPRQGLKMVLRRRAQPEPEPKLVVKLRLKD